MVLLFLRGCFSQGQCMHLTPFFSEVLYPNIPEFTTSTESEHMHPTSSPSWPSACLNCLTPIMEWLHRLRMARSSPWLGILPPGWGFDLHKRNIWNGKKYQQRDLLKSTSHCRPLEDFPSAILDRQTWQWREHFGQLGWTWTWKGNIFGGRRVRNLHLYYVYLYWVWTARPRNYSFWWPDKCQTT